MYFYLNFDLFDEFLGAMVHDGAHDYPEFPNIIEFGGFQFVDIDENAALPHFCCCNGRHTDNILRRDVYDSGRGEAYVEEKQNNFVSNVSPSDSLITSNFNHQQQPNYKHYNDDDPTFNEDDLNLLASSQMTQREDILRFTDYDVLIPKIVENRTTTESDKHNINDVILLDNDVEDVDIPPVPTNTLLPKSAIVYAMRNDGKRNGKISLKLN